MQTGLPLRVVLLLVALVACASGEDRAAPAPLPVNTSKPYEPPPCQEGVACSCGGGPKGTTACEGNRSQCVCPPGPSLDATPLPPLEACGGDPKGMWRSTGFTLSAVKAPLFIDGRDANRPCIASVPAPPTAGEFDLELRPFGKATYTGTAVAFDELVALSCTGEPSCADVHGSGGAPACTPAGGGVCSCLAYIRQVRGLGNWKQTDSSLKIWVGDESYPSYYQTETFDFCVEGNKLTLQTAAGLRIELVRSNLGGEPTDCLDRSAEQCVAGDNCGPGACLGGGQCPTTRNKAQCNSWAGCEWADEKCGGFADKECKLGYSSLVPGCKFIDGTPSCTGTPKGCNNFSVATCTATAGCVLAGGECKGTPTPGAFDGNQEACKYYGGTYKDGKCTGLECNDVEPAYCEKVKSCKFFPCKGTPDPCATLPLETCEASVGCSRVIEPPAP